MPQPNGVAIQARREQLGLTRRKFAGRVEDLSYQHLYNIETGRKAASIELLWRISRELELPIGAVVLDDMSDRRSA
jgi:transcriptional regulator with XRE-family HTH domain